MNSKKSKLIFFITLAILVIVFIITIFLRNSTKPISQPANINTVDTMFSMHNTPVKIKITKFKENSIDTASPYICYISDTNQLKNFTDKINSLLNTVKLSQILAIKFIKLNFHQIMEIQL